MSVSTKLRVMSPDCGVPAAAEGGTGLGAGLEPRASTTGRRFRSPGISLLIRGAAGCKAPGGWEGICSGAGDTSEHPSKITLQMTISAPKDRPPAIERIVGSYLVWCGA